MLAYILYQKKIRSEPRFETTTKNGREEKNSEVQSIEKRKNGRFSFRKFPVVLCTVKENPLLLLHMHYVHFTTAVAAKVTTTKTTFRNRILLVHWLGCIHLNLKYVRSVVS